jgi:hypothetical protein
MFSHLRASLSRSVVDNLLDVAQRQTVIPLKQVFTGDVPFHDKPPRAVVMAITGGERPPRPTHQGMTDGLWALVQLCWDQEARKRPHALRISCAL